MQKTVFCGADILVSVTCTMTFEASDSTDGDLANKFNQPRLGD